MVLKDLMRGRVSNFSMPVGPPVVVGAALSCGFYLSIFFGLLDQPLIRRYCLGHPVAMLTVTMFFMSVSALLMKYWLALRQWSLTSEAGTRLAAIIQSTQTIHAKRTEDQRTHYGDSPDRLYEEAAAIRGQPAEWLHAIWQMEPTRVVQSWFGFRLLELLGRQVKRGDASRLDEDLRELSEKDADSQHESYGIVRIMTWAMPMLGFLGTVIGISTTLGRMDTKQLATGSQEAMNSMTAGLYVAFDTTAVALVLTIVTMFLQFTVTRIEQGLLRQMDAAISSHLVGWLANSQAVTPSKMEDLLAQMTTSLKGAFESLLLQQAKLWSNTIAQANDRWQAVSSEGAAIIREQLLSAIAESLESQNRYLEQLQSAGAAQLEARCQQWQTSFSEQSRVLHTQQRELAAQTVLLKEWIEKGHTFEKLDQTLEQNLKRLTDVDRFYEAAMCMTEAVAFLGTQLERSGVLRHPVKPATPDGTSATPTVRRRAA